MAGSVTPEAAVLPPLREDLQIVRGGVSYSGAPVWIVLDPVRNKFFRITFELFQLLTLWNRGGTASRLNSLVEAHFGRSSDADEIGAAIQALDANQFLAVPTSGTWRGLHRAAQRRHSLIMQLVHNYLFFKIPLVRPERFLQATWPRVSFLFSRMFLTFATLAGITGLYLISRQWETFAGTFSYMFTFEGLIVSFLSIAFIKSLHELGHAYVAHRYGCRVPTMGMAMMFLVPLLYTDVTEAWKLRQRRQRLAIDIAGVAVELCVAAFALLLWSFLPDGPMRSAVFILATTGWVLSLLINANPFMRFDGYYIFADLLGVENLQQRAFGHLKWRIRELLFGFGASPPEQFPPRLDFVVTAYAIATAIYRLLLYIGIALLVYHFFIKIVGIALFVIEMGFFIIRPVWHELKEWIAMREDIRRSRRTYLTLAVIGLALILLFVPISSSVSVPAVMQPVAFARIYPAEPGRLEAINVQLGDRVRKGDILFVLASPANQQEQRLTDIEIDLATTRLERIAVDIDDLAVSGPIRQQLASLQSRRAGQAELQDRLVVRAPFDGVIGELNATLYSGRWISRNEQLAYLADDSEVVMRGYVDNESRARIGPQAFARFIPDDLTKPRIRTSVATISTYSVRALELPELASAFGGPIAVHQAQNDALAPVGAEYAILTQPFAPPEPVNQIVRGILIVDAQPESIMSRLWRGAGRVFVREFGF